MTFVAGLIIGALAAAGVGAIAGGLLLVFCPDAPDGLFQLDRGLRTVRLDVVAAEVLQRAYIDGTATVTRSRDTRMLVAVVRCTSPERLEALATMLRLEMEATVEYERTFAAPFTQMEGVSVG